MTALAGNGTKDAVVEMLKRKQAGMPVERQPEAAVPTKVVNLMDALWRSIAAGKAARPAPVKGAERKRPTKDADQRSAKGARKAS
jgi:DNA end-binding protein Ku